ncbi:MAG: MXAN_5187 C-terminal domain-containing protein [Myxococcaceae bacterium]
MKNLRTFIATVSAVSVVAAIVGFFIVFQVAPQSALARLLVDIGALIALISACMTVPKVADLRTDEIADGLRDLARGRYDRRLVFRDFAELSDIAQAFNELAGTLSDNTDPGLVRIRTPRLPKTEPVIQRSVGKEEHSYHPELGQVEPLPSSHSLKDLYEQFKEAHRLQGQDAVDYETFENTLGKAKESLMSQHQVKSVRFEVVLESGEVALRPRLVR